MAPRLNSSATIAAAAHGRLGFNADAAAIVIALALAALVRFNILPHVGW